MVVVVDGLQDRLPHRHERQVLLHDLHVVAERVQGGELYPLAGLSVILVVVVGADRVDPVLAEDVLDAPGEGGLARGRVPDHTQHDRPARTLSASRNPRVVQPEGVRCHRSLPN